MLQGDERNTTATTTSFICTTNKQTLLQTSMKIGLKFAMLTVFLFSFVLDFGHCVNTVQFLICY